MTKYSLYRKFDVDYGEPVDTGSFISLEEAVIYFAKRKDLPLSKFTSLFKVRKNEL